MNCTMAREDILSSGYDLDIEVLEKYKYEIHEIIPVRKVFILNTSDGNKILKKVNYDLNEVNFINNAMKYLKENKFSNIIDFKENVYGDCCTKIYNNSYVVMDFIEGREATFYNPIELKMITNSLAKMHNASEGFRYKNNSYRYEAGMLIEKSERKMEEIQIFKKLVEGYEKKTKFDNMFLENVDYYLGEMKRSIDCLKKYQYLKLCSFEDKISLCHQDLVARNIIINKKNVFFIDFDYSTIDLRIYDLCNFINRFVKNFAFEFEKAKTVISEYSKEYSFRKQELQVLHAMLIFPGGFYNIVKNYYKRKKGWEEETFNTRLEVKIRSKNEREEFLKKFNNYYCK